MCRCAPDWARCFKDNVVAFLALCGALGGTAPTRSTQSAAPTSSTVSVKSADVGNGEIGSADVKDNSINTFDVHSFLGADVVDGSLTGDDIGDGTRTGSRSETAYRPRRRSPTRPSTPPRSPKLAHRHRHRRIGVSSAARSTSAGAWLPGRRIYRHIKIESGSSPPALGREATETPLAIPGRLR